MSNIPTVGLGQQSAFGTVATTFAPVKVISIDSSDLTVDKIEGNELYGTIDSSPGMQGTRQTSMGLTARGYPEAIGTFLNMAFGDPTTTGAATPWTHTFVPTDALPKQYSVGFKEDNGISTTFKDVSISNVVFTQATGQPLQVALTGLGTTRTAGSVTITGTPETGRAFKFSDMTATVGGAADANWKNLTLTIANPASNIFTLNGTDTAATQEYTGMRVVTLAGTMRFVDDAKSYRANFEAFTSKAVVLTWQISVNQKLVVTIPDWRIDTHSWSRGFDTTEVDVSGTGYYDGTNSIKFELTNGVSTYPL